MTSTKTEFIKVAKWIEIQYVNDIKSDFWQLNDVFENKSLPKNVTFDEISELGLYDERTIRLNESIIFRFKTNDGLIDIFYMPNFREKAEFISNSIIQKFEALKEKIMIVENWNFTEFNSNPKLSF